MTIRVSARAHEALSWMAGVKGTSMQSILDEAIEAQRRLLLLEQANEQYALLQADPVEVASYAAEMQALEGTLNDGLKDI